MTAGNIFIPIGLDWNTLCQFNALYYNPIENDYSNDSVCGIAVSILVLKNPQIKTEDAQPRKVDGEWIDKRGNKHKCVPVD